MTESGLLISVTKIRPLFNYFIRGLVYLVEVTEDGEVTTSWGFLDPGLLGIVGELLSEQ